MTSPTKTIDFQPITAPEARDIANGIWWGNFWKVAGILGVVSILTIPVSVYAYSSDKDNLESKIDYLIQVVKEDVKEVKVALADEKKTREKNEMEIRQLITTMGAR